MEDKNYENPQNEAHEENTFRLKEDTHSSHVWYWIIAILILILFGWYGYSAGWFSKTNKVTPKPIAEQKENQNPFSEKDLADISEVKIITGNSFPVEKTLVVKGTLPNGCTYLNDPQILRDGNTFYVNVTTKREGENCTQEIKEYELPIKLDVLGLPAGVYTLVINGKNTQFELEQDNKLVIPEGEEK